MRERVAVALARARVWGVVSSAPARHAGAPDRTAGGCYSAPALPPAATRGGGGVGCVRPRAVGTVRAGDCRTACACVHRLRGVRPDRLAWRRGGCAAGAADALARNDVRAAAAAATVCVCVCVCVLWWCVRTGGGRRRKRSPASRSGSDASDGDGHLSGSTLSSSRVGAGGESPAGARPSVWRCCVSANA